jgi:hypothetical protein
VWKLGLGSDECIYVGSQLRSEQVQVGRDSANSAARSELSRSFSGSVVEDADSPKEIWLLTCLALTLERLYRLRYLHRSSHPVRAAINLCRLLLLTLSPPVVADSS